MEALMARLVQASTDTFHQLSAAPKAAPLVETRTLTLRQRSLASTKTGQIGHYSLRHTCDRRIPRQRWKRIHWSGIRAQDVVPHLCLVLALL